MKSYPESLRKAENRYYRNPSEANYMGLLAEELTADGLIGTNTHRSHSYTSQEQARCWEAPAEFTI